MIKVQYNYLDKGVFANFYDNCVASTVCNQEPELRKALEPYQATLGKSKQRYRFNIKFRDRDLYTLFVLRWS